jgi:hypothetical protein
MYTARGLNPALATSPDGREDSVRRKKQGNDEISWDDDATVAPPEDFLPGEAVQEVRLASNDLRDRVSKLETQMMAQYTAMAAYAQIAQNNNEAVRAEGRHDLDRSQSTVIGLIERVRRECTDAIQGAQARQGTGEGSDDSRLAQLEQRFEGLAAALERSIEAQRALAEQVAALIDEKMHSQGWLVANGNGEDLSLR